MMPDQCPLTIFENAIKAGILASASSIHQLVRNVVAVALFGISRSISAIANASNNSVKPLLGRDHGTSNFTTLPSLVLIRGTAQCKNKGVQRSSNAVIHVSLCHALDRPHRSHQGSESHGQNRYAGARGAIIRKRNIVHLPRRLQVKRPDK
jgi:hypothetical protein